MDILKPGPHRYRMRALLFSILLLFSQSAKGEDVVSVDLSKLRAFTSEFAIKSGRSLEVCTDLEKGTEIDWWYSSSQNLDFNIHHHVRDKAVYALRKREMATDEGGFVAASKQNYCWMWTNKSVTPASLVQTRISIYTGCIYSNKSNTIAIPWLCHQHLIGRQTSTPCQPDRLRAQATGRCAL